MSAPRTLVLLPGLDGTDVFFGPLLAALPSCVDPRVITYPQSGGAAYVDLLALVRATLAGLPQCYVVGWSFSGPLALMLAAAEPAKVRGVILAASFVRPPSPLLSLLRFALVGPPVWLWRAARRLPLWLLRPPSDAMRCAKSKTWKCVSASVVAARLRAIAAVDARSLLQACRQPLLYLASSRDGIVPRRNAEEVLRLRPSARLVAIEGPHLALFTNPQAAAAAIAQFVADSEAYGHQSVTAAGEDRAALS
ncbi:MAG TPA: alpha/beta fold hydrolase [Burkholderiales bacterium]|nr:alpha/beta fold hydrolase [Burkholderiales bacterium]